MTIQEAMHSGKPFKRELWGIFITVKEYSFVFEDGIECILCPDDVLETDWEVKEGPQEIVDPEEEVEELYDECIDSVLEEGVYNFVAGFGKGAADPFEGLVDFVENTEKKDCEHDWKKYQGLFQEDNYCTKCGKIK